MKTLYIKDIFAKEKIGNEVELLGWLRLKRNIGGIIFLDVVDSTGTIVAKVDRKIVISDMFDSISKIPVESAVRLRGIIARHPLKNEKEITVREIEVLNKAVLNLDPYPRKDFDVFAPKYIDFVLKKRHLFLRNPKIMAVMRIKYFLLCLIREWFKENDFIEIDTPILTQATYYEDKSTYDIDYFGTKVYLSQCAGLYLGAAVLAFEKVYTISPAFRKQPSRSPRHNPEFTHIKGQAAFYDLEDTIEIVENIIFFVAKRVVEECEKELEILGVKVEVDSLKPPYIQISYTESLKLLKKFGVDIEWGKSLNEKAEKIIADKFGSPVFVVGMPSNLEPFPYLTDPLNPKIAKTADLLAPNGFGEILGVAEFTYKIEDLILRMKESGKYEQINRLRWYLELAEYGNVPHSGFGIGLERLLRWLLKLPHVRDTFAFPRLYGRVPYP